MAALASSSRSRGLPRAALFASLAWLVLYALGIALVHDPAVRLAQSDLVYAVPDFVGAMGCGWVLLRRRVGLTRRLGLALRWLGASCGLSFAADMLYAGYYYVGGRSDVFPSWADPIWLASDAALIMAIVCAFSGVSLVRRLRGALDALVAGFGLAAALWVTGVGDTAGQSIVSSFVTIAYPVADLVMLVLLISVGVSGHRRLPLPLTLLGLGCGLLVATDLVSAYTTTFQAYAAGSWLDLGWQASALLTVLVVVSIAVGAGGNGQPLDDPEQMYGGVLVLDRDVFGLTPLIAGVAGAFFVVVSRAPSGNGSQAALFLAAATVVVMFVRLLLSIVDQRAVSSRLDSSLREQKQLAITDVLTDLYNRRFIEEVLRLEASRAARDDSRLAAILLDVDGFKKVNDTHGHQAGDVVLAEVAARIRRARREADVVGRWGGEEFLVVLPGTDLSAAIAVSDRILRALSGETIRLVDGTRITVTASAGVAMFPRNGGDVDSLLWQADQALYAAKENGRNRAYAWDSSGIPVDTAY